MDVWEARAVLGVADTDGWEAIRAAYRHLIRSAHPDVAEPGHDRGRTAARLNEAYGVLSRAKRAGVLGVPRPAPDRSWAAATAAPAWAPGPPGPPGPAGGPMAATIPSLGIALVGTDTLLLAAPPDEAFARLLDAGHRVGAVTYVDRSCAIFEVVVRLDGEACSLVVTLQGRAHGTEAFLTLESLERVASHSPEPILRQLAAALA
ncbi:MAG TPA: DnaJ domain-containing protein [Acidimicrobiales bacterium]|nr:DnaJ domain-containing protein [Acidimicrobiales bacterium]